MSRLERVVYLVAGALLAAACMLLIVRSNQALSRRATVEAGLQVQLSKAQAQVLELEQEAAELKGQLLAARAGLTAQTGLTREDVAALEAAGLQDPTADLIASLEQRTDLIPIAGSRFEMAQRWIISRRWVIARFTDGHGGGWLLLRYQVADGQVEWTLLDSLRDDASGE